MIILFVLILFCVFYFIIRHTIASAVGEAIGEHSRIVDDVFFEKDKKIEDLQYELTETKVRVQSLEEELSKRNHSTL